MDYKVYTENTTLCLTPEHKLEEWIKLIHKMASEGNIVKLYADTETTGFEFGKRGRPAYDPVLEQKSLARDAAVFQLNLKDLEQEAKDLAGKVDRMIEIAFVACYTNKNNETYPLLDKDGEQVFFHEMIHPNTDNLISDSKKVITKMPTVPYMIHQTSFDFLEGKEEHPFLKIKLDKRAPSTTEVFTHFREFFEYEDDAIFDNIMMFFHNANGFDVPFLDSELERIPEMGGITIRDIVKVYDSLELIKPLLPNPVQKLIMNAQSDEFYGGDPDIKNNEQVLIKGTSKSLDNLIKIARFLPDFNLQKVYNHIEDKQEKLAKEFKKKALSSNVQLWPSLLEYFNNPSLAIDLTDDADKDFLKDNKSLADEYKKFKTSLTAFNKQIDEVKSYGQIYNNLLNLQTNIETNNDLRVNIECIQKMGREAHGAKVDSMLFMYAFNIIENSLYKNQRQVNELKINTDIQLSEEVLEHVKKKTLPKDESVTDAVNKFSEKYADNTDPKKDNRIKQKI
jgi:hypothetical protein